MRGYTFHALANKEKKFRWKKKKIHDLGMVFHTPLLKRAKKQQEHNSVPSHPRFYIFKIGWDWGWVIVFPPVSLLFERWSVAIYYMPLLNPFCFLEEYFVLLVMHICIKYKVMLKWLMLHILASKSTSDFYWLVSMNYCEGQSTWRCSFSTEVHLNGGYMIIAIRCN